MGAVEGVYQLGEDGAAIGNMLALKINRRTRFIVKVGLTPFSGKIATIVTKTGAVPLLLSAAMAAAVEANHRKECEVEWRSVAGKPPAGCGSYRGILGSSLVAVGGPRGCHPCGGVTV